MGIKIKVQGVPYYVCLPATADVSRISVPVLPENYVDWNDTLSNYLLEDQYRENGGSVRWESPACVAYGYSKDGDCGSVTSDSSAFSPFYSANLRLQEHPILGMRIDKTFSLTHTLKDFVFYTDYIKATIDIETNRAVFLDFNRTSSSQYGYHFICGKGKHTVTTKIFPKYISYNNNSSCKIRYEARNIDASSSQTRTLTIDSIPMPRCVLSICDLDESPTVAKYTAWNDTNFAEWKDAHWKANTKILSITSDNKQNKNTWSSKYVISGIAVGRYTDDWTLTPGLYDSGIPLSVSTAGTIKNYVSSKMNSNGFINFNHNISQVNIGITKDSTLPVAVGDLKGYSGTASPLYSSDFLVIRDSSISYSSLPIQAASLDAFASPWDTTALVNFSSLTSLQKNIIGYHFPDLAINPLVFEYDGYKIRCRNALGSNITYRIFTRWAYNDWNEPTVETKENEEWIDLTTYVDNNNNIVSEIKIESTIGNWTATCDLLCPLTSQSRTFLFTTSQAVLVKPNIAVLFDCDNKTTSMLVQNCSTVCTTVKSANSIFNDKVLTPGCSGNFTLPYETFTDTVRGYWNNKSSYSQRITPVPTALNYTTDTSTLYKDGTVQVYWCNIPVTDTTIKNTRENRHFMVVNNRSSEVSLILNGGEIISLPTKTQYQSDNITTQQGVKVISTLNDVKYCWEMKTPTSSSTASFTTITSDRPYRFAKLGRFRTVVDLTNPWFALGDTSNWVVIIFMDDSITSMTPKISLKVGGVEKVGEGDWNKPDYVYPNIPSPYNTFVYHSLSNDFVAQPFSVEFSGVSLSETPYCIAILDTNKIFSSWDDGALSEFYVMQ